MRIRHAKTSFPAAVAAAALLIGAAGAIAQPSHHTAKTRSRIRESSFTMASNNHRMQVEQFQPAQAGKYPVLIELHGADGLAFGAEKYRMAARLMAARGYIVLFPHYFQSTGTPAPARRETMQTNFPGWLTAVRNCADHAANLHNARRGRIGLVGISLGAYLALASASRDGRYRGVAEYFGGLTEPFISMMTRMPPVLILHGDADGTVPVSEAYKLAKLLRAKKSKFEIKIYHGQGHGFSGSAKIDSLQRVERFMDRYLKR